MSEAREKKREGNKGINCSRSRDKCVVACRALWAVKEYLRFRGGYMVYRIPIGNCARARLAQKEGSGLDQPYRMDVCTNVR